VGDVPVAGTVGWHRIAIAAIVDQGQVLADVGQEHSLTCGFAVNVNIRGGVRIFKIGEERSAPVDG
jgi:tryptophanase